MRTDFVPLDSVTSLKAGTRAGTANPAVAFYSADNTSSFLSDISVKGSGVYKEYEFDLTDSKYSAAKFVVISYYDSTHAFAGRYCETIGTGERDLPTEISENSIAIAEINRRMSKNRNYMHFSFDDYTGWENFIAGGYASIFDDSFLADLKEMHDLSITRGF